MFATEPHVALEMLTVLEFEQMFDATKLPKLHGAWNMSMFIATCTHVGCYEIL